MKLSVLLQPRASRDAVVGRHGAYLKVAVTAVPVDGQANAALVRFLAMALGVKARQVSVLSGLNARRKVLNIEGLDEAALGRAIERCLEEKFAD